MPWELKGVSCYSKTEDPLYVSMKMSLQVLKSQTSVSIITVCTLLLWSITVCTVSVQWVFLIYNIKKTNKHKKQTQGLTWRYFHFFKNVKLKTLTFSGFLYPSQLHCPLAAAAAAAVGRAHSWNKWKNLPAAKCHSIILKNLPGVPFNPLLVN